MVLNQAERATQIRLGKVSLGCFYSPSHSPMPLIKSKGLTGKTLKFPNITRLIHLHIPKSSSKVFFISKLFNSATPGSKLQKKVTLICSLA